MNLEKINLLDLADYWLCMTQTKELDEKYADDVNLNELEDEQYDKMVKELGKYVNSSDLNVVQTIINDYIATTDDIHFVLGMKYLYKILRQLEE